MTPKTGQNPSADHFLTVFGQFLTSADQLRSSESSFAKWTTFGHFGDIWGGGCAQKVKKGYFGEKGVFYPFHPFSPFLGYMVKRTPFWPVFRPILRVYGSKGPKIGLF